MPIDAHIAEVLERIAASLNELGLEEFDTGRVQSIVGEVTGDDPALTVDDGGGLHEQSGARLGAIRRSPSGEWVVERQNPDAPASEVPVPEPATENPLRRMLDKLRMRL